MMYKILLVEENAEKDMSREQVVDLLRNDVAEVNFTKTDGSDRVMSCTLLAEVLSQRVLDHAQRSKHRYLRT